MSTLVALQRTRNQGELQQWTDFFLYEETELTEGLYPEQAMRKAIEAFLSTNEGAFAMEQTCNDFNWGDAISYVPAEIWAKHGLTLLVEETQMFVCIFDAVYVDQDEVLIPFEIIE